MRTTTDESPGTGSGRSPKKSATGGNPPVAQSERRTVRRPIRFTPSEFAVVASYADAAGCLVACYIRESALGSKPPARPNALADEVIYQLTRVGTQLRELGRVATAAQFPNAERFDATLRDLLDLIGRLSP